MPRIEGYIIEKWSKAAVPNAEIRINDTLMTKSIKNGWFTFYIDTGTYELKVSKVMYEDSKQTVTFIGDTNLNIIIQPIMTIL